MKSDKLHSILTSKHFSTILLLFSLVITINAQSLKNFNGLHSKGELPEDIVSPTYITYEKALQNNISVKDEKLTKKAKKNFVLSSSYYINDMLVSGDIIFNDTISVYLNRIKDLLLQDFPELKQTIRIYTYKSPIVNALATNEGAIFVTTGLLARLNTEAQLAYIISHEISHFDKKHPINKYVEKERLINSDRNFRNSAQIKQFKTLASKSREAEMEADIHGYNYFHKTNYNKQAPEQTFDLLKKSNIPYEVRGELTFKQFCNFKQPLPENVFKTISFEKFINADKKDTLEKLFSSHPALDERIDVAKQKNKGKAGSKDFIISESLFNNCQSIARAVYVNEIINAQEYEEALYYCYLLQKEFGEEKYVMKLKLRCLYEIAKIKKYYDVKFNTNYGCDLKCNFNS